MESILEGHKLPSYTDLARYVFYTATGEEFDSKQVNEKKHFIGETKNTKYIYFISQILNISSLPLLLLK